MGQVVNVKKIKNSTAISKIADHNLRQKISANVDSNRTDQNLYLIGSPSLDVLTEIETRLNGIKYRKDANKVCNLVFSASHEEMSKIDPEKWAKEITAYCEKKFGKENILYSVLHRDELTEHLHLSFIPIIDNKLRSNVYFDGPSKLSKFRQEIYNTINKKYGFKKDQPEKKAKAQAIAKHYQEVNDFEKLERKVEMEFKQLDQIPKFSINTRKVFQELTPTFQRLVKFAKGLKVNFTKLAKKYKLLKKEQIESAEKIQHLERRVASLELKLENLGLDPDISLKQCMSLKPAITEVTAIAEAAKLASSKLPKDEENSVDYSTFQQVGKKIKPH